MNKPDTAPKNIRWINYMRAVCMIAIYYIHAESFFEYSVRGLAKFILPFYVNAFFFVSGYLLFRKQMSAAQSGDRRAERKKFLLNLLFRMVIPNIIMSVIFYVPASILQHRGLSAASFIDKTLLGQTFWFVSALVVAELLVYLLIQCRIQNMLVYILFAAVCFLAGCFLGTKESILPVSTLHPWKIDSALMAVPFLVLGGLYWKYESAADRVIFRPAVIAALAVMYVLPLVFANGSVRVLISMVSKETPDEFNAAGLAVSTVSIILLLVACKSVRNRNRITDRMDHIGKHTLGLYFVCGAIPKVIMRVLPRILPKGTVFYMLCGFVLSFLLCYAVVCLLEKYLPFLFDLRRGIRRKKKTEHC